MRQYKFRCWDVESERWVEQVDVMQELAEQSLWNPERSQWYIITQFTGLTDKNGKEIYEGDVLKVNYSGHWMKEVVIYEYGAFKKRYHEESGEIHNLHFTSLSPNNTEVIGNLYETPDLLTPQPNP